MPINMFGFQSKANIWICTNFYIFYPFLHVNLHFSDVQPRIMYVLINGDEIPCFDVLASIILFPIAQHNFLWSWHYPHLD